MTQSRPRSRPSPTSTAEHAESSIPPLFTGWHYFLAHVLQKTRVPGLDVHCFVKLGSLPLEADVIILQLDQHAEIELFRKYFGFLVPSLRPYLVIEYKGPDDRLTSADFDTVRAYAMLCKRKYEVVRDRDLAVAMLYSHTAADFFARCADNGLPFVRLQPGVRACFNQAISFYALDLVALGKQQPRHPINLLSARRRAYGRNGSADELGPFAVLYEEVFLKELKKMNQTRVPGSRELLDDAERLQDLLISRASLEQRLRGIAPEDRLRGLPPEDRLRGLPPKDRLRGLSPAELDQLRELLLKPKNP